MIGFGEYDNDDYSRGYKVGKTAGYKAGQDALACCGCCEWITEQSFKRELHCRELDCSVWVGDYTCKGKHFTPRSK